MAAVSEAEALVKLENDSFKNSSFTSTNRRNATGKEIGKEEDQAVQTDDEKDGWCAI